MPDTEKLLSAIDTYADNSIGSGGKQDELGRQRALSLDAFAGKLIDVPPPGRSRVSDRSLFETWKWMEPSLVRIFAGGDNIVEFDPVEENDEDAAEQESDYLNYKVMQSPDEWELMCREWMQDAALLKNAYCLVDEQEKIRTEVETYEGKTEEQVAILLEDDVQVIGQRQYDDPDDEGTLIDPANGQPIDPEDTATSVGAMAIYEANGIEPQLQYRQLYDVQLRKTMPEKRLRFSVLEPDHCKVGEDTKDFTLEDCNYFEYWDDTVTISEVRSIGYDVPDDIDDDPMPTTQEDESRDEPLDFDTETDQRDPAMRQITLRTVWIRHDYDEDGIAELQKVVLIGRTILDHEPASRIPVACITPYLNVHRHIGMSIADLMFEVQRIKTKMLRGGLDSLELALRPRHATSKKVTVSDLLESVPGGVVRVDTDLPDVQGHMTPIVTQNSFPDAMMGMEQMDRITEARVGVNRMFQGIDASNVNDHNRIGQLSTMAAQRVEDIARIFGIGFKRLFSLAHEIIQKSARKEETVRLRGTWVNLDPTSWKTGRDMRITAPFSAGNKDALLNRLMIIAQFHEKALAGGLPIVTAEDSYELALEVAKAADLSGTKYFTDPKMIAPPPEEPDHTMIALEVEAEKVKQQEADSVRDAELKQMELALESETRIKTTEMNNQTAIAIQQIKEGQSINLEATRALLKDTPMDALEALKGSGEMADIVNAAIEEMRGALQQFREQAEAPIDVVRENGRIVGKNVNGRFIPIRDSG